MNLIKDITIKDIPHEMEKSFTAFHKTLMVKQGICLTCSNKPHCVWLENNKLLCEHFD